MVRVLPVSLCCLLLSAGSANGALQAFQMPWNDASAGITNLQAWQPTAAGANGWVTTTAEGHYELAGQPLRFLGVNVTAADCFPTHERAEAHAARLARFGFNAVRFHHMEAPWEKSAVLIDYASGNSRTLSAERLDRLHYFVAQLAGHGLYSNINLLVSREFQPADGLGAEIAQLAYKDQHILGFFMDEALALHREHATQLLSAPNPHRGGKTLALDPAVAFVEIQNENSLVQKWFENVLDTLPSRYLQALQARWNSWLRARYASTAAVEAAWGAIDEPLAPSRLLNGSFAQGTSSWNFEQHSGAAASATGTAEFNGTSAVRISVTAAGSASWNVQLAQGNLSLVSGRIYTLSFWAKAAATTPLSASLTRTGPTDYAAVAPALSATLGTGWQQYSTTFQAVAAEGSVRLVFNGFGDRSATVWLADARFSDGGKIGGVPAGATLESGNVPTVRHNGGSATARQTRDWIAFLLACEKSYWDAMKAHLGTTLGYRGIIWGTIASIGTPNTQVELDAMDSHAYWQHPQFPADRDWDPELWTVANTSMVNSPASNTLTAMARQRVKGYPHNATEYQHASPNTYGSEAPILAAAYSALQDWDSLWWFEYKTGTAEYVTGFFDHGAHPGKMVNNLLAACLFRRGDVQPARQELTLGLPASAEAELARTRGEAWSIVDGSKLDIPATLSFTHRLSLSIGETPGGLASIPTAPAGAVLVADTGELRWDASRPNQGVVTIDTPRTKAVVGFTAARSFDLGGVVIAPGTTRQDWSTIGLALLEGQSFAAPAGARGIIVATGDQENTGQVWKDGSSIAAKTSVGTRWGSAPALVEVVPATITLPVPATRVTVWALTATGQRGTPVAVRDSGGLAQFDLGRSGITLWYEFEIASGAAAAPSLTRQPATAVASTGSTARVNIAAEGNPAPSVQWSRNGSAITGATNATLAIANLQPRETGLYQARLSNPQGTRTSDFAILGLTSEAKIIGVGTEVLSNQHVASNGNTFDQILLGGSAIAVTADHALNQITRTSFIDLDDDIVQVEMSGPGTLSLVLDASSGPATPTHYNQSTVSYMKGHAGIVITGADERTNVSVFSVGRLNAFDPTGAFDSTKPITEQNHPSKNGSSLFVGHETTDYDGIADIAFIAIASTNGKFGGVRAANANFLAAKGVTGLYAPGVTFLGPVYLGDVVASADAAPVIRLGAAGNTRITGGDLLQDNGAAVQVSGITQLVFANGSDSHGNPLPAQNNRAVLQQDGVDVTTAIVVNPGP
jgi:hypothetical protein